MKKPAANIGMTDKLIRLILAFILLLLVWSPWVSDITTEIILLIAAFILALTSYLDFCFLYYLFGISTRKTQNTETNQ